MTRSHPTHSLHAADFRVIETALSETARGRWFLHEFARRRRAAEMPMLLEAVDRLASAAREHGCPAERGRIPTGLSDMQDAIARARTGMECEPKVIEFLRDLETRVAAMLATWEGGDEPTRSDRTSAAGTRDEGRLGCSAEDGPALQEDCKTFGPQIEEPVPHGIHWSAGQAKRPETASADTPARSEEEAGAGAQRSAPEFLRRLHAMTPSERLALFS